MILTLTKRKAAEQGGDVDSTGAVLGASKHYLWPGGVVFYAVEGQLSKYSCYQCLCF